ncbi:MAG: hypothetical protein IKP00_08270 [Victivallales bacterium]|nr:hypothetical protein [Victivallales bacterium]
MSQLPSSFRDPAGYVFEQDGELFRQLLPPGAASFERFTESGLAQRLMEDGKIVAFSRHTSNAEGFVLHLNRLPYISYPYEWCFSQLRDAGILTLKLMLEALDKGMILKDATAFNVAFQRCHPIFLDHTSFELYQEGTPWRAYRQFVMHFLAPLLLMQKVDLRCLELLRENVDGIPLDFASRLLPWHTWLQINPLIHIHLHALMEQRYSLSRKPSHKTALPKARLLALIHELHTLLSSLKPPKQCTLWADYYSKTSYLDTSFAFKRQAVREFCEKHKGRSAVDLGANCGLFSQIAAEFFELVLAADFDGRAVEELYRIGRGLDTNLQPVLLDLNNPSPDLGVLNEERSSFFSRTKADIVMGLALIHHLRITGNWSIGQIVALFSKLAPCALVEFIPLDDIQVQQLTRGREQIYQDWTLENLCAAFQTQYAFCKVIPIPESGRSLIELAS